MDFIGLLDEYVFGKIDEDGLYKYIKQKFNELFSKYKFRELEYLKIYPFLSELQDEDLYKGVILKTKIKEIKDILNGQDSFLYDLWMNLTPCEMSLIHQIWSNYKENGAISFVEFEFLQNKMMNIMINAKTIEDVCWEKLLTLLIGLPTVDDDFYTYNLLYTKEIDKISICEEIERLIDILQGEKPVHILLRYTRTNFVCNIL